MTPLTGFDLCRAVLAVMDITAPEKSVLMVLAIMADKDDATCFPPINGENGLTAKTCLSERAVQRAIQRLKDLGHISRRQLRHGCIYTVHPCVAATPVTETGVSETPVSRTPDTGTPVTEAVRGATVAPKQPRTTILKKDKPSSDQRAPAVARGARPVSWPCPEDVDPSHWADLMANRKSKRLANTPTALAGILRDIAKHADDEWPPGRIVQHAAERGWGAIFDPRPKTENRNANHRTYRQPAGRPVDGFTSALRRASAELEARDAR